MNIKMKKKEIKPRSLKIVSGATCYEMYEIKSAGCIKLVE